MMELKKLLESLTFYNVNGEVENCEITSLEMDSRKVTSGSAFVCITGFTVDGHDYVDQAVKKGASAVFTSKPLTKDYEVPIIQVEDTNRALAMLAVKYYDYPTKHFPLIGVTGTNGKTTVTYLLDKIFEYHQKKAGVIGTIQVKIGEETFPIVNTTPNALELQKTFHMMREKDVKQGIMEVSSHALDMGRVYGCDYDIAVFTNLSQDHLDYHQDIQDYLRAKSLLFAQLGNGYNGEKEKYAIINDDDSSSHLLKRSTAQHVITYSCKKEATIMAKDIELAASGIRFKLHSPLGEIAIQSRLMGMFNVYNMLAASAAAIASKVPLKVIQEALESIEGVNGRFEPIAEGQDYSVIVDFAHTPDSLENVLQTIKDFAKRNVYVVVGCGGDRDRKKRPLMAEVALNYADHAVFTSDNPRTEDPQAILDDMTAELDSTSGSYEVVVDRKEGIAKAIQSAQKDDIILIAGKGHETYQIIGHTKYDFDDRDVARNAIKQKGV